MKKIYSVIIVLALIAGFSSCSNGAKKVSDERPEKITEPEHIGLQVFDVLKNIDYEGEDGDKKFAENFLSYQEMLALGENDNVTEDEGLKKTLSEISEEEWTETINEPYVDLMSMRLLRDIRFENSEYKYFTYHLDNDNGGGKFVKGSLGVELKDELYEFETYSIWNGEEYMLIRLNEYQPVVAEEKVDVKEKAVNVIDDPKKLAMVENIGYEVFEMLKNIDVKGEKAFMSNMLSLEELNALSESDRITTDPEMKSKFIVTPAEYTDYFASMYGIMKTLANESGIVWKDIEYYKFVYDVIYDDGGGEFITGLLAINYNGKLYPFTIYSFWDVEKYVLLRFDLRS